MQKITPFLWFDNNAEEAIDFYVSVFKDSEILNKSKGPDGKLFSGAFRLFNQVFNVINAGPEFKFTEAISFFVDCKDQEEVDYYWNKLTEGGEKSRCGWLKDKFGMSWQIIPKALSEGLSDSNPEKAQKVMQAMLKMNKIIVSEIEEARK